MCKTPAADSHGLFSGFEGVSAAYTILLELENTGNLATAARLVRLSIHNIRLVQRMGFFNAPEQF